MMKHRSNKVNFLSYSSRRKRRRGNQRKVRELSKSLSDSTNSPTGLIEESDATCTMEIDVSQMLLDDGHGDHVQELDHSSSSAGSMIPFIDTSSWLGAAGELSLTKLPSALYHVCNWWKTKVNESFELAKDVVFPSRVYRRELYATQEQINLLQEELHRVKEEMESKKSAKNSPAATSCSHCCCPLHSSTTTTHTVLGTVHQLLSLSPGSSAPPLPLPPPAAPPPPAPPALMPPPPPPPPPPPAIAPPKDWRLNLPKRKKGSTSDKKESNKNPGISLADIKGVKLKKVDRTNKKSASSSAAGGPLVTLSDLQAVQLKKSFKHSTESTQITSPINLRKRLSLEAKEFRTSLKRAGIPRSPGGTPFRTKPAESGVGLTPIMTRALKRKFRSVITHPISPCSSQTSPSTPPGFRI